MAFQGQAPSSYWPPSPVAKRQSPSVAQTLAPCQPPPVTQTLAPCQPPPVTQTLAPCQPPPVAQTLAPCQPPPVVQTQAACQPHPVAKRPPPGQPRFTGLPQTTGSTTFLNEYGNLVCPPECIRPTPFVTSGSTGRIIPTDQPYTFTTVTYAKQPTYGNSDHEEFRRRYLSYIQEVKSISRRSRPPRRNFSANACGCC